MDPANIVFVYLGLLLESLIEPVDSDSAYFNLPLKFVIERARMGISVYFNVFMQTAIEPANMGIYLYQSPRNVCYKTG